MHKSTNVSQLPLLTTPQSIKIRFSKFKCHLGSLEGRTLAPNAEGQGFKSKVKD